MAHLLLNVTPEGSLRECEMNKLQVAILLCFGCTQSPMQPIELNQKPNDDGSARAKESDGKLDAWNARNNPDGLRIEPQQKARRFAAQRCHDDTSLAWTPITDLQGFHQCPLAKDGGFLERSLPCRKIRRGLQ